MISIEGSVQIAGIHDLDEANLVKEAGADFLGFPLRLPVNSVDLTESKAKTVISQIGIPSVLITYQKKASEVIELCQFMECPNIQLHGLIALSELHWLRENAPDLTIIKSIIVRADLASIDPLKDEIAMQAPYVDAFILDSHNPQNGADGATGLTHDWSISRELVAYSTKPVILAGGLTPENVATAIAQVKPAAVDTHTGVEGRDLRKDADKVKLFVEEARKALKKHTQFPQSQM
ncbi:MAG: phosphoribosylanthranilate isomerase [Opitutales bacterium]|nr:phosphoribosylanthranilate isomerase [Opitutales bacterium]